MTKIPPAATSHSSAPHGAQIDPQCLTFLVQVASLQAQRSGGVRHPLMMPLQLRQNQFAFESVRALGQRAACATAADGRSASPAGNARRTSGCVHCAIGQQQQALDHVAQFAHVAGPGVALQLLDGLRQKRFGFQPLISLTWAAKCSTSAGMSPSRSRSGGSSIGKT